MKTGKLNFTTISKKYTKIDSSATGFGLYEHNNFGEDNVICVDILNSIYCYTDESLLYTINNKDEFEWYKMRK